MTQTVGVSAPSRDPVYFMAPGKCLASDLERNLNTLYRELKPSQVTLHGVNQYKTNQDLWKFSDKFLGDQRTSYNQDLSFKLRIGENGPSPTIQDVILEGAGLSISQAIFGQGNKLPTVKVQY